jgi:hypothetical protein
VAFHHVESYAIDMAFFSAAYCGVELGHAIASDSGELNWGVRTLLAGFCLVCLCWAHRYLSDELGEKIGSTFEGLYENANASSEEQRKLRHLEKVVKRSVLVSLSGPGWSEKIRKGKRIRREEALAAVVDITGKSDLSTEDFLLPKAMRRVYSGIFAVVGLVALLTPVSSRG